MKNYRVSLNVAINDLHRLSLHGNAARAVHEPICDDGLGINPRKGFWCIAGENGSSWVCHCD